MTTDRHATRFRGVFELPVTPLRYYQSPPVGLEHPDYLTYLHEGTISEGKNQTLSSAVSSTLTACTLYFAVKRDALSRHKKRTEDPP